MADIEDKIKSLLDSPDSLDKILQAARSFMGESGESSEEFRAESAADENAVAPMGEESLFEQLDPHAVSAAMQMMSEYRKNDDRRIQLLKALRSYFGEEDQIHISKAIRIVKLSKVAKQAFRSMREEDSFV